MRKNIFLLVLVLSLFFVSVFAYKKHQEAKYYKEQAVTLQMNAMRSAELARKLQEQAEMQVRMAELARKEAEQARDKAEQELFGNKLK